MLSLGSTLDFLPSDYRSSHVGWVGGKILVVIRPLGVVVGGLVGRRGGMAHSLPDLQLYGALGGLESPEQLEKPEHGAP